MSSQKVNAIIGLCTLVRARGMFLLVIGGRLRIYPRDVAKRNTLLVLRCAEQKEGITEWLNILAASK